MMNYNLKELVVDRTNRYYDALFRLLDGVKKKPLVDGEQRSMVIDGYMAIAITKKSISIINYREYDADSKKIIIDGDVEGDKFPYLDLLKFYLDQTLKES